MKLHRITALIVRHLYLYRRSLPRIMEIFYWPFLDLVIWGFITLYLTKYRPQVPGFVTFFLGCIDSLGHAVSLAARHYHFFSGRTVGRNLMNLFASPLTPVSFSRQRSP